VIAAVMLARAAAGRIGAWIAAACDRGDIGLVGAAGDDGSGIGAGHATASGDAIAGGHATAGGDAIAGGHAIATALHLDAIPSAIAEVALPLLGAAAIAAVLAQVAQTRALWMPRRRIDGAPEVPRATGTRAGFELASAAVVGAVAFGWLWTTAPRLAVLVELHDATAAVGAAIASLVVALAIAWLTLGVADALIRRVQLAHALAMTPTEKREDDRLSAADPRWVRRRRELAREPAVGPAVARAAVVIVGDDVALAIAWDAVRQPVPVRTATGRRARATQLVALARRHRIPVHRDAALAASLVDGEGPIAEAHWPRLAEIVAAVRGR
jgi:flagellar biosynthesis protein FlhB